MSLVVVNATGPISIQDLGRRGHMHEGVPPGGAVVPTRLIAANREAANRDDAPGFEVYGLLTLRAETRIEIAKAGPGDLMGKRGGRSFARAEGAMLLDVGDEVTIGATGWTYLAVRGGVAAPEVLGGRGSVAGLGARISATGVPGKGNVTKGDRVASAGESPVRFARPTELVERAVRVLPGPDLDAFEPGAIQALCREPYAVVMPARTGARLSGAAIPRVASYRARSRPMVRGAIEVPPDGLPIVLGADHPTTGGYPILAVVASEDLERVFAFKQVRFTT